MYKDVIKNDILKTSYVYEHILENRVVGLIEL